MDVVGHSYRRSAIVSLTSSSRLLARHQSVLARLRSEIESVVGLEQDAPEPSRSDLKKMTYLSLVIKEGMLNSIIQ